MAVKLRLERFGAKKAPFYRIVAIDSRRRRDGRFIEQLGYYEPQADPAKLRVDLERVDAWLEVGATPTDTVKSLIARARKA